MKKSIGFIGCGKMASAIIKGIQGVNDSNNFEILGSEVNVDVAKSASDRLGINVFSDNKELAKSSDIVFIATKPNYVSEVVEEIKNIIIKWVCETHKTLNDFKQMQYYDIALLISQNFGTLQSPDKIKKMIDILRPM